MDPLIGSSSPILGESPPFEGETGTSRSFQRLLQGIQYLGTTTNRVIAGFFTALTATTGTITTLASTTATIAVAKLSELQVNVAGAAKIAGTATLASGTVTVTSTKIKTGSIIHLTPVGSTAAGLLSIGTITDGTSFVINSASGTDARVVHWSIRNPIT